MSFVLRAIILIHFFGAAILPAVAGTNLSSAMAKRDFGSLSNKDSMGHRVNDLRLYSEGPNCWNAALLKAGLVHSVRFVPKGEYWHWMQSPYCRELKASEQPQSGDLGSLFWKGFGHYHSFIYMDETWVFSKNSPDPKYDYSVQPFENMFASSYKTTAKECWQGRNSSKSSSCDFKVVFHRCRPLERNFFRKNRIFETWENKIKPLEQVVFLWTTAKGEVSLQDYEETTFKLYLILQEIEKQKSMAVGKSNQFTVDAFEYRVIGLLLADVNLATMVPNAYPYINFAYQLQAQKKQHIPQLIHW